jgi:hypothetical protein
MQHPVFVLSLLAAAAMTAVSCGDDDVTLVEVDCAGATQVRLAGDWRAQVQGATLSVHLVEDCMTASFPDTQNRRTPAPPGNGTDSVVGPTSAGIFSPPTAILILVRGNSLFPVLESYQVVMLVPETKLPAGDTITTTITGSWPTADGSTREVTIESANVQLIRQ